MLACVTLLHVTVVPTARGLSLVGESEVHANSDLPTLDYICLHGIEVLVDSHNFRDSKRNHVVRVKCKGMQLHNPTEPCQHEQGTTRKATVGEQGIRSQIHDATQGQTSSFNDCLDSFT